MGNVCAKKGPGASTPRAPSAPSQLEEMLASKVKQYIIKHNITKSKSLNQVIMKFPAILKAFEEMRSIFNTYDADKSGTIEKDEFIDACTKMQVKVSAELINQIYEEADMDHNAHVSFKEFIIMITCLFLLKPEEVEGKEAETIEKAIEMVLQAFLFFDQDGDGFIQKAEVTRVLSESTPSHGKGEGGGAGLTAQRFGEMDWDQNDSVSFKEFLFAIEGWVGLEDEEDE